MNKTNCKKDIIDMFNDLMCESDGICGFISKNSSQLLFDTINNIENEHLTKVQFDQLLALHHLKCMSDDFFDYYWINNPEIHYYKIKYFNKDKENNNRDISSLEQLKQGFERLFIDCLYIFGNVQKGYDVLCERSYAELNDIIEKQIFNTKQIEKRGNPLQFVDINKEERYLISEIACKTFENISDTNSLTDFLIQGYEDAILKGVKEPTYRDLIEGVKNIKPEDGQMSFGSDFLLSDLLDTKVKSKDEIRNMSEDIAIKFKSAHKKALDNTELYLSLSTDLDVYVATSMRTKKDFTEMAIFCDNVFKSEVLKEYNLRYFDPTISAAESHEDKGLIECLMVKSSRILIYHTGKSESYGKDVEAAMALSLGKPVIFFCSDKKERENFFKNIHPLSRLVNFETGVAVGAIVCKSESQVIEIMRRLISNEMEYKIEKKYPDDPQRTYYLLKEKHTNSTIRIQTDDKLLTSAFWNNY